MTSDSIFIHYVATDVKTTVEGATFASICSNSWNSYRMPPDRLLNACQSDVSQGVCTIPDDYFNDWGCLP